jgi:peroxiredoxin Q/BCP
MLVFTRVMLSVLVALAALSACGGGAAATKGPHRLEPISVAPDFSAPDEAGKVRSLSEFRGRPLVLYFYPKDGTPGCTREACAFRDEWQRLQATGAHVVGVSLDSVESHAEFKRQHALPFPLLSDTDGSVLEAYGVTRNAKGYAARTTFIIDAEGIIRRIFPEVDPAVHVKDVLAVLEAMKREGLDGTSPKPQ